MRTVNCIKERKICIISQYFPPDLNGDVTRLLNILKALKKQGFKVTIISAFPHYPDGRIPREYWGKFFLREKWQGIEVIRTFVFPLPHRGFLNRLLIYMSFSFSASFAIFLVRDVMAVWGFSQKLFSYFPGLLFKLIYRTPLILDVTDVWPEAIVNTGYIKANSRIFRIIGLLFKFFYKLSDRIVTLTDSMKKMIASTGINSSKIIVIPNIVDVDVVKPTNEVKGEFKGKFTIMYSGNLGSNYDFKTLLETALALKDRKDILFVIRGKGEKKHFITSFMKANQLKNVYIDERLFDKRELVKYLNKADIFILPMKKCPYPDASLPIKLLDYLACGKPVICCAGGFLSEIISTHQAGISIPPGELKKLVKAILLLKENTKLREKLSENARQLALKLFSYDILEEKVKELLNTIQGCDIITERKCKT